jgi:hypothetical protein
MPSWSSTALNWTLSLSSFIEVGRRRAIVAKPILLEYSGHGKTEDVGRTQPPFPGEHVLISRKVVISEIEK